MNPEPATVLRDYLDWTKAVHGGGATQEMHRELTRSGRPFPTWDDADAALDALIRYRADVAKHLDAISGEDGSLAEHGECMVCEEQG